jgi:hypothetical protein
VTYLTALYATLTPGQTFLLVMGVEYLGASLAYLIQGNPGMSFAMLNYGLANFGLMVAVK